MDTLNTSFIFIPADAETGEVSTDRRLRVIILDGALRFVAADVYRVLGISQASNAARALAPDECRTVTRSTNRDLFTVGRGGSKLVLISESGFYKLVMRSDKPAAGPFQEWVTREVLPAIRRTGGYRLAGVAPEAVEEGTVAEMPDVGGVVAHLQKTISSLQSI